MLPSFDHLAAAVNYAPQPIRPLAQRLMNILRPLGNDDENENDTSSDSDNDSITAIDDKDKDKGMWKERTGMERICITPEAVEEMRWWMAPLSIPPPVWRPPPEVQPQHQRNSKSASSQRPKLPATRQGESRPFRMPTAAPESGTQLNHKWSGARTFKPCTETHPTITATMPPYLQPQPASPIPTGSTPALTPSPYSVLAGSSPVLTGSDFLLPTKTSLHKHEEAAVAAALEEALSNDFFNVWPRWEDPRPGRKISDGDASLLFQRPLSKKEQGRRGELMREWKARPERGIERRARYREGGGEGYPTGGKVKGKERAAGNDDDEERGYESVLEARELKRLDMFRPTLMEMVESPAMDEEVIVRCRCDNSSYGSSGEDSQGREITASSGSRELPPTISSKRHRRFKLGRRR